MALVFTLLGTCHTNGLRENNWILEVAIDNGTTFVAPAPRLKFGAFFWHQDRDVIWKSAFSPRLSARIHGLVRGHPNT